MTPGAGAKPLSALWSTWSMAQTCEQHREFGVWEAGWTSSYHSATETARIGKLPLLVKGIVVVVRHPLIAIPRNPLYGRRLIPYRLNMVVRYHVLDLLEGEDSTGVGARAGLSTPGKLANAIRSIAGGVSQGETPAVLFRSFVSWIAGRKGGCERVVLPIRDQAPPLLARHLPATADPVPCRSR